MIFSDTVFLFVFLPIVLLLYYLSKNEYRNYILLVASLLFYACGEPKLVLLMIISIFCNYFFALSIDRFDYKNVILVISIFFNLGVLFVFKYLAFSVNIFNLLFGTNIKTIEITLPIGISFYTFQSLSYIIDVYTKKSKVQNNILNLGLYVSLFPQLIAGPIVRYNSVAQQIENRELSPELFGQGAKRFICGFCKKVILANNLSIVAEYYFGRSPSENSIVGAWIGAICFSFQIFYDFSGYSDMAIGLGKMLGFEFEENFNYPYIAHSITDFWRRWHISLSRWFRDYIYIPLGGAKVSVPRHILNMAIVWILTGIWHGADYSFILWGMMYFIALVVEKYVIKPEKRKGITFKILYRILVLLYINFSWVIFNAKGIGHGIKYCLSMLGGIERVYIDSSVFRMLREYGVLMFFGIVFCTPVARWILEKGKYYVIVDKILIPVGYMFGFAWAISFLILGAHNPFIYFNF